MSTQLQCYSDLLFTKENPEVVRFFEKNYVEQKFKDYLALKVPLADITTFFHKSQITGANPVLNEIYLIPRNVKVKKNGFETWETVGTIVFSYNFIRRKAQQSGEHHGMVIETKVDDYFDPIAEPGKEIRKMLRSTATVHRKGHKFSYTAWWSEYVQTNSYGVNAQWKGMPHTMLGKCAEAGVLRMAFPEWLSGAYVEEEMGAIEKNDDAIVATFTQKENIEKAEEIQDRIEHKMAQADDMEKIEGTIEAIKGQMTTLTKGADVSAKGKAMKEHLGVNKFDDLKKKSLADLELKLKEVTALNAEKAERVMKEVEKIKSASTVITPEVEPTKAKKPSFTLPPEPKK